MLLKNLLPKTWPNIQILFGHMTLLYNIRAQCKCCCCKQNKNPFLGFEVSLFSYIRYDVFIILYPHCLVKSPLSFCCVLDYSCSISKFCNPQSILKKMCIEKYSQSVRFVLNPGIIGIVQIVFMRAKCSEFR